MQVLLRSHLESGLWRGPPLIDNRTPLSRALKEKREDSGIKQGQIGEPLGIDQTTVSLYERNPKRLRTRGADFTIRFIRGYGFTEEEARSMAQELFRDLLEGLAVAGTIQIPTPGLQAEGYVGVPPNTLPEPRSLGKFVHIELLQAQGGISEFHDDNRGSRGRRMVEIPEYLLNGNRVEDCKLVEIFGDSMACEDVRLSIPEGSSVIINTVEEPQTGDILVADLLFEDEWRRVLKIVDRKGHIILHSYNDEHPPIPLREGMELQKIGVYINHIGPGRQAMRQINKARMGY